MRRADEEVLVANVAGVADERFSLSEEQEDQLLAAMSEIDRGKYVTFDDLLRSLQTDRLVVQRDPRGWRWSPPAAGSRCRRCGDHERHRGYRGT